ncbi:hypothetical protein CY34DRAFT_801848 [Suillus luteus UH-Slu-Lm8-n1]|uniref:Uncharacterized protein n=1 Tax=Suillus luteus UH-Slu-Lm8-n1 TaxID=930992 RepID=A0A0D0B5S5_9AGAM|nr:hypothetical protein CY34DRAFT_801848 [Suillus luteus UH-Slu-Lm8-n1]
MADTLIVECDVQFSHLWHGHLTARTRSQPNYCSLNLIIFVGRSWTVETNNPSFRKSRQQSTFCSICCAVFEICGHSDNSIDSSSESPSAA